jgi:hypothetical protein
MILIFTFCFITIFAKGASQAKTDNHLLELARVNNMKKVYVDGKSSPGRVQPESPTIKPSILFGYTFLVWITAVFSWIVDILMCDYLQNLPFGIPYINFHSGWHIFVTLGLHLICTLFLLHERLLSGANVKINFYLGLPYLSEKIKRN